VQIKNILPIFEWLPAYRKTDFKGDLWAGLTVGVMLIPQGMAYAMIAGLPPIYGLYAAFLPQVIYSIFGTSRQLSVAPVAMISLLIGAGISELAEQGSTAYIHLAILLALIVGILQLLFGLFRMGFLVNFLSKPVITGYTSSAAIIIGLSQLKHLLGIDMPSSNLIHKVIYDTSRHIGQLHFATVLIGVVSITIILLLKKMSKSFPGPLVMVAAGVALVSIFNLESVGVRIIGSVPEGLPKIAVPQVSILDISNLLPLALLISLVSFMESMTISKVIQSRKKNYKVSSNKELIGLGMANISGSFFGSFPVSGGFSRTAVNEQTGANTNLASWISAALVGLTLLFFTPLFYNLPTVILAAIIMVSVIGLIDLKTAILLFKTNKKDFAMLLATFLSTLLFGVQIGIITGVVLSLGLVIQRSVYPHLAELGKLQDTNYYRNLSRFPEAIERKDALIFRFDSELYFANINYFKDRLEQMMERKGAELKVIILNAQSIYSLDSSAASGLEEILENCHKQKIEFYMTEVIGPVRDTLRKTGLYDKIGEDHFLMRVQDALDYFDTHEKPVQSFATQTNQNN
jgi:SulP family sulfate permease